MTERSILSAFTTFPGGWHRVRAPLRNGACVHHPLIRVRMTDRGVSAGQRSGHSSVTIISRSTSHEVVRDVWAQRTTCRRRVPTSRVRAAAFRTGHPALPTPLCGQAFDVRSRRCQNAPGPSMCATHPRAGLQRRRRLRPGPATDRLAAERRQRRTRHQAGSVDRIHAVPWERLRSSSSRRRPAGIRGRFRQFAIKHLLM